jgi:predicted homoserine dehydrogenase-like protein
VAHAGTTEVVSSLNRDMSPVPNHLKMGTYVVVEAATDYVRHCFEEYWLLPDSTNTYSALYRPTHFIGLELGISVASVALRGEATGAPTGFRADVVATAKRGLKAGEVLDGEGGYTVWGKQMPAQHSLDIGGLPLGLANNVRLKSEVGEGQHIRWCDVEVDDSSDPVRLRREMETLFAPPTQASYAAG